MRTLDSDFITEKNKSQNRPIRLYRIEGGQLGATVLCYAENPESVTFGGHTYHAAPIRLETVGENMAQEIDQVQVSFGAADQAIIAYLESADGLRGCKVTIRTVFADLLADASAFTDDIFYVASVILTANNALFTLKSKLDVLRVEVPLRRFYRLTCQWRFKSTECGYAGATTTCNHDAASCDTLGNLARFGGFPGTGSAIRRIYL